MMEVRFPGGRVRASAGRGPAPGRAGPTDLILVLPYVLTVVLLAGFFGRAEAPRALGTPYVKEH